MIRHILFSKRATILWAAAVLGLLLAGCGSDSEQGFDCGQGTVLADGECVPVEHDCPEGEVATPGGVCQEPGVFCGQDAVYDAAREQCLPVDDIECGEGTVAVGDECRIEDPLACGEHTVLADGECRLSEDVCGPTLELDETRCELTEEVCEGPAEFDVATGDCVHLDSVVCGENTIDVDDVCLPHRTAADVLAAQADLDYTDDVPITPIPGDDVIFTGTLEDRATHTFELDAAGGQWVTVTLFSRGIPSPAFTLRNGALGWTRSTVAGLANIPSRTVAFPVDDSYDLTVRTSVSELDSAADFGDESWEYVGRVEVVDAPEPQGWQLFEQPLEGTLTDAGDNLYLVDVEDQSEVVGLTADHFGDHVHGGSVELWSSPTNFISRHDLDVGEEAVIDTDGLSPVYLHFDAVEFSGPDTDFTISTRGGDTVAPGQFEEHEVSATAGQMLYIVHHNNDVEPMAAAVYHNGELMYEVDEVLAANQHSYESDETKREFFYVPEDGDYLVEFENTTGDDIEGFISTSYADDVPVFDVDAEQDSDFDTVIPAEELDHGDWRFVVIDSPTSAFVDIEVTVGEGDPDLVVFDTDRQVLHSSVDAGQTEQTQFDITAEGIYIVAIRPFVVTGSIFGDTPPISGGIDVDIEARPIDTIEPGETKRVSFDADTFDLLTGTISYDSGDNPDLRLLNPNDQIVFEEQQLETEFELMELLPGPGEFSLELVNSGENPTLDVRFDHEVIPPLDVIDSDDDVALNYEEQGEQPKGQRQFIIYHPKTDLSLFQHASVGTDEEAALKIWDIDSREVVAEQTDEADVDLEFIGDTNRAYALELEALSALDDGYEWSVDASKIKLIDEVQDYDPPLEIEAGQTGNSLLSVDDCGEIADVSISVDISSGFSSDIDLYAPGISSAIRLRSGSGSQTTVYPDETTPHESLDPLIGTIGDDVWSLDVINNSTSITMDLNSWGVHLVCLE